MKKSILFIGLTLFIATFAGAQVDPRLRERLDSTMMATHQMDFEKIMEFTYPKLFTIVKKEQMIGLLKSSFESEEFGISLDSLEIISISPVFKLEGGSFAKIKHKMIMVFKIRDMEENGEKQALIAEGMKQQYGKNNVISDPKEGTIRVSTMPEMVAVKDKYAKEWCFVNYKKNDQISSMLFSKAVLDKLATL